MLTVVPTPVGNMSDITLRAIEVLTGSDIILAEDTRVTRKLLDRYAIQGKLRAYHAHNEHKLLAAIVAELKKGSQIALVSDAGTPSISDPGFLLIRECIREGVEVTCLPGATALIPALVISGFPTNQFHFEGFLPLKKGRRKRLEYLSSLGTTFVLYESPLRLLRTLQSLLDYCDASRGVAVIRELSKMHEEVIRGTLESVLSKLSQRASVKGECVIVCEGRH